MGIGLSDGETMERLWSYLRRFSRMTKEMRPSHRVDVLTSALLFYGLKTKKKLGESYPQGLPTHRKQVVQRMLTQLGKSSTARFKIYSHGEAWIVT